MRYLICLLFILNISLAQKFVYVSSLSSDTPLVGKLFLSENGESKALTDKLEADDAAYDPEPSPDGQEIAYLEKNGLGWSLVVVDLTGNEVARWDLPGSQETFRPAGGFQPTWLGDKTLLAQTPAGNGWDIYEFLFDASPKRLAEGFGIFLSPDKQKLLTNVGENVMRVDLKTRQSAAIGTGEVWGWVGDDRAVILQKGDLYSVKTSGDELLLAKVSLEFLAGFSRSPDGTKFALVDINDEGAFVQIYDGQGRLLRQAVGIVVDTLEWLDDETLLISYQQGESKNYDTVIATLALDGTLTELVNSEGADYMAKPVP
jgi:hypothetical protein